MPPVLRLPLVESGAAHPVLSANVCNGSATLSSLQNLNNLKFGKSSFAHTKLLLPAWTRSLYLAMDLVYEKFTRRLTSGECADHLLRKSHSSPRFQGHVRQAASLDANYTAPKAASPSPHRRSPLERWLPDVNRQLSDAVLFWRHAPVRGQHRAGCQPLLLGKPSLP